MNLEIPWEVAGQLDDQAWCRVVELTAETAIEVAKGLNEAVARMRQRCEELYAEVRRAERTADTCCDEATDNARLAENLQRENESLRQTVATVRLNADRLAAERERWQRSAELRLHSTSVLADIVASRAWFDLFREEAGTLDDLIEDGRKIEAIKQVREFLPCGLFLAKTLVEARQKLLREE